MTTVLTEFYGKRVQNQHNKVRGLIPIESYVESMRKQKELAAGVKRVRFFLATDDADAEAEIKAAFKPGALSICKDSDQGFRSVKLTVAVAPLVPLLQSPSSSANRQNTALASEAATLFRRH